MFFRLRIQKEKVDLFPVHIYRNNRPVNNAISPQRLEKYIDVIQKTSKSGIFPILTLNHLALMTRINYFYIRRVIRRQIFPYNPVEVLKKDGGKRTLYSPEAEIKLVQRWILENILDKVEISPFAFAYRKNHSVIDAAKIHLGAKTLLKFDFSDFFPGISEFDVYKIFIELGYTKLLSFELARICTIQDPSFQLYNELMDGSCYTLNSKNFPYPKSDKLGFLAQGIPTSGAISNIFLRDFDKAVSEYCLGNNLVYSRYSDDIAISSHKKLSRSEIQQIINFVRKISKINRVSLNEKKLRVIPPGRHKTVLGLILGEGRLQLPKRYVREVRQHIEGASKMGVNEYSKNVKFRTVQGFKNYIDGKLSYIGQVDSDLHEKLAVIWSDCFIDNEIYYEGFF